MTEPEVDAVMARMRPEWRDKWCGGDPALWDHDWPMACACIGCANVAGGAAQAGVTYAEWRAWKDQRESKS